MRPIDLHSSLQRVNMEGECSYWFYVFLQAILCCACFSLLSTHSCCAIIKKYSLDFSCRSILIINLHSKYFTYITNYTCKYWGCSAEQLLKGWRGWLESLALTGIIGYWYFCLTWKKIISQGWQQHVPAWSLYFYYGIATPEKVCYKWPLSQNHYSFFLSTLCMLNPP